MVEIFSRPDGPRPQDARLKAFLDSNRSKITGIADALTGGGYSASKAAKAAKAAPKPEAERAKLHIVGGARAPLREARPVVRATLNGRVVAVDEDSGRQLHHLGEIRRRDGVLTFVLASAANRFPAPVAPEIETALDDLDRAELADDGGEAALVAEIAGRLGFEAQ